MAITIKCPDCGHTEESKDGVAKTCPQCEGTMAAPPKKKYQAKSTSLEDEERAKKKSKARDDDRPSAAAHPSRGGDSGSRRKICLPLSQNVCWASRISRGQKLLPASLAFNGGWTEAAQHSYENQETAFDRW